MPGGFGRRQEAKSYDPDDCEGVPGQRQKISPYRNPPLPPTHKYQVMPGLRFRWLHEDEDSAGVEIDFQGIENVFSTLPNQVDPEDVVFHPEWLDLLTHVRRSIFSFEFRIVLMIVMQEELDSEPRYHCFDVEFQVRNPKFGKPRFTRKKHPTQPRVPFVAPDGTSFFMYRSPILQECLDQIWGTLQYILEFVRYHYLSTKTVIPTFFLTKWTVDQDIVMPVPRKKSVPVKQPKIRKTLKPRPTPKPPEPRSYREEVQKRDPAGRFLHKKHTKPRPPVKPWPQQRGPKGHFLPKGEKPWSKSNIVKVSKDVEKRVRLSRQPSKQKGPSRGPKGKFASSKDKRGQGGKFRRRT
jgi:hypothetical protein